MSRLKLSQGLPDHYAFKSHTSNANIHRKFFEELARSDFHATMLIVDKSLPNSLNAQLGGNQKIAAELAKIVCGCQARYIDRQTLRIDLKRSEKAVFQLIVREIKTSLWSNNSIKLKAIVPVADHR